MRDLESYHHADPASELSSAGIPDAVSLWSVMCFFVKARATPSVRAVYTLRTRLQGTDSDPFRCPSAPRRGPALLSRNTTVFPLFRSIFARWHWPSQTENNLKTCPELEWTNECQYLTGTQRKGRWNCGPANMFLSRRWPVSSKIWIGV